jgi:two-component system, chemotaxis family, sensor kinase CheA
MRIPLTLAIIPALIVRSVNQSFALPQGALSELVHIPPEQAATAIEWIEARRSTGCAASCCRWSFLTGC